MARRRLSRGAVLGACFCLVVLGVGGCSEDDGGRPVAPARAVSAQNAGGMDVVNTALALTGWGTAESTAELAKMAIDPAQIEKNVPGSGIDLKTYIGSGKDVTGQDWARPHHALSQWHAYHALINDGVDLV